MRLRFKRILQKVFIAITVPLVSLSATLLLMYIFSPQPASTPALVSNEVLRTTQEVSKPVDVAAPAQLTIKNINVSAVIKPVGLNSLGDMDIDENPAELAWYKFGPKPGEKGSAVVAGHYGWKNGVPSVFNDLRKLVEGDEIVSVGKDGSVHTFVVKRSAVYAPDQDATDIFRSKDGKAHLNLITCQGTWNNSAQTYSERLVVFTDLVEEKDVQ